MTFGIILLLIIILFIYIYCYDFFHTIKSDNSIVIMLGSGGHTAEMIRLLADFDFS
jgi:hypothetical protein